MEREITEGSLAHGREDVSRSKFIGEDDQANVRAGTSNFSKKLNIFRDASFPPGDDQIEWLVQNAIDFYSRIGFRVVGEKPFRAGERDYTVLVMRLAF